MATKQQPKHLIAVPLHDNNNTVIFVNKESEIEKAKKFYMNRQSKVIAVHDDQVRHNGGRKKKSNLYE